jgi:glycosyltransferase involved in cell wall biosynthesis
MEGETGNRRLYRHNKNVEGMKRILIFSLSYFPNVGGAEVAIKEITDRIPDIEFHLITHRFDLGSLHEEKVGNMTVHRIGNGSSYLAKALFVPRAALAAVRLHRMHKFDGAWAMMSYMVFPIVILKIFGARLPYAITLQEGDTFDHVFRRLHIRLVLPFLRFGFRRAHSISAISTFLARWAEDMGYTREVQIIPNGVDCARFAVEYPTSVIDAVKEGLGKKMGDVFLITTSRLVHKNALDDVLRALPLLPENVSFVILGTGPEKEALQQIASDLQIQNRVHFVGHVGHDEMPKYLRAADIFIRPSRSEGMGNSFVEAFAAGLPVIATQEGGLADLIFDEKRNPGIPVTAWAVDKDAPEQIAAAVCDIMAKPEKVRAVVATARALTKEKYDWDIIARMTRERVFGQVLGE